MRAAHVLMVRIRRISFRQPGLRARHMIEFDIQTDLLISLTFFVWALILYLVNVRGQRRRTQHEKWRKDSLSRWN